MKCTIYPKCQVKFFRFQIEYDFEKADMSFYHYFVLTSNYIWPATEEAEAISAVKLYYQK